MKTTIVIPTYWRGPASESDMCTLDSDYLYDHATPLDSEGTLRRALASLSVLESDEEFAVAVVAASTRIEIKQAVEIKVRTIIAEFEYDFPFFLIGPDELVTWRRRLAEAGMFEYDEFLSLDGYSNIRNMCLLAAFLTGADVAVLFDDDQVYEDKDYLRKALEFIGGTHEGTFVGGVAGYYERPEGGYLLPPAGLEWERKWGNHDSMNEAFGLIGEAPRLKRTPFVFGGNMVIHRTLFEKIPFDPRIPRGEDIDYLLNARLLGYEFFLDNQLAIKHIPPAKCAPPWYRLRKDIIRFSRERAKILSEADGQGLSAVSAESLDPYPGRYLKSDFHDLVMETSLEMAKEYLEAGMEEDAAECIVNVAISKAESTIHGQPLADYIAWQKKWEEFIRLLPGVNIWTPGEDMD